MLRKLALVATAAVSAAALSPLAAAQGSRAFRTQPIRAGVIVLNYANNVRPTVESAAPFAWYNLDSAATVKPSGWNLVNPNNEGTVSQATYDRWRLRDTTIDTPAFQTRVTNGLRTQKRYASYWEVNLATASDTDLAQYDVLLFAPLTNGPRVGLSPQERTRLTRYVDGGGVLWVDVDSRANFAPLDPVNVAPIPFNVQPLGQLFTGPSYDPFHPLFTTPLTLGGADLSRLGGEWNGATPITNTATGILALPAGNDLFQTIGLGGDFGRMRTVAQFSQNGNLYPTTMVGKIGDGYEVITVRQVAEKLNRTTASTNIDSNRLFLANEARLFPEGLAAARFAVNLVSLTSSSPQFGGGGRKNFASGGDLGAPLLPRYTAASNVGGTASVIASSPKDLRPPVVYKGLVIVAAQNSVSVYDADPSRDQDGDGDPDDGLYDTSIGEARDLICQTLPLTGRTISSATVAEVIDAQGGVPRDQLLVVDNQGTLYRYPIYGNVINGRRTWLRAANTFVNPEGQRNPFGSGTIAASTSGGPKIFPPTVYNSVAYLVDTIQGTGVGATTGGRVRAVDLRAAGFDALANSDRFAAGNNASGYAIPAPSGPATVGEIPIADNSGGSDIVAYVPVLGTSGGGNSSGPGFVSLWVGAKGEKPFQTEITDDGSGNQTVRLTTRANTQSGLPVYLYNGQPSSQGVRVSMVNATTGAPATGADMAAIFSPNIQQPNNDGVLVLTLNQGQSVPTGVEFRVDYTIDWGKAYLDTGKSQAIERGRMTFSDALTDRRVIGGIALGPQGTIFAAVGNQNVATGSEQPLGTVYAIKEEGRGSFRMTWRWDLYPRHTFAYEGGQTTVESVLPDNDPVQFLRFGGFSLGTFLGGRLTNTSIQGAPVVRGDKVFVTITGRKTGGSAASAILCFAADPPEPEIRTSLDLTGNFAIVQPDFARSSDPTYPRTLSILSSNTAETVTFDKSATGVGGTIRFPSLAGVRNGQVVDSISLSEPVIIRRPGQGDVVVEPDREGNNWSPLRWYTVLHGTQIYGPAFASGNTLYVSGGSVTPQYLVDGTAAFPQYVDGVINAFRTDVDTTNALPTTSAYSTNTAAFAPQSVVLDAARPWLRQLISIDFPRASAAYDAPQASDANLYGNPYFVYPQNPRNTAERGRFTYDDYRIRLLQSIIPGARVPFGSSTAFSSLGVVGGDKTLVTWNEKGTVAFNRSDFWVADEGRIAQIDPSGNVLFDSRASLRLGAQAASGAANVYPLVRPTRVVPVEGDDDLLVVDTGANKILRMNPGGVVSREIGEFAVDPLFAPNGFVANAPLTLKNPRDATTFVTRVLAASNGFSNPSPAEEWIHTLIADEGNRRLVEVVDRYAIDPSTYERLGRIGAEDAPPTLLWQSPAQVSGKGYDYVSVSRVRIPNSAANPDNARYAFVAGLGNFSPGRIDAGEAPPTGTAAGGTTPAAGTPPDGRDAIGGGVVVFDPQLPAGVAVYSAIDVPEILNIHRWGLTLDPRTGLPISNPADLNSADDTWSAEGGGLPAQLASTGNAKRLSGVSSVTASVVLQTINGVTSPVIAVMVADRTGVYEVVPVPSPTPEDPNRTVLTTRWMLTNEAFRAMRRIGSGAGERITADSPANLRATYARRLDSENVILVNGFVGKTRGSYAANGNPLTAPTAFNGEVLQIDGLISSVVTPRGNISDGFNVQNDNLGFGPRSIKVRFGILEGARGILQPVFADRR